MQTKICVMFGVIVLVGTVSYVGAQSEQGPYRPYMENSYALSPKHKAFLDSVQYHSFLYFVHEINAEKGLVKDRSTDASPASIATMGWALPVWAIGVEKGWLDKATATQNTLNMLEFLVNSAQSPDSVATGYRGWYYHFLKMDSGLRAWNCELSTIDTAWLIGGILFARNYYNGHAVKEVQIRELAEQIVRRLDWKFVQLPPTSKVHPYAISMAWKPEDGLLDFGWFGYTEGLFLYILGGGLDMPDLDKAYATWLKTYEWAAPAPDFPHLAFPPMFGHQYSQMFIDFRGLADRYMKAKGCDYFENSRRAVYTQRMYAITNPRQWAGFNELTWGITACDGPGENYCIGQQKMVGYAARGAYPRNNGDVEDGTLAPTALGGSVPFAPEICIPALMNLYVQYGSKGLWGKYGFKDAFNPTVNWYDTDYLGLDQGPFVIMIENYYNGFVWKHVMQDALVQKGLQRLGFEK